MTKCLDTEDASQVETKKDTISVCQNIYQGESSFEKSAEVSYAAIAAINSIPANLESSANAVQNFEPIDLADFSCVDEFEDFEPPVEEQWVPVTR